MPAVALIGTLDTKSDEIAYVRERLQALRVDAVVIDSGILGEPGFAPDFTHDDVAAAGDHTLAEIRAAGSRGAAVALMQDGVRALVVRLFAEGRVQGVLCLGGAEGALLGAAAMQALPVGVPKLVVSPSASGRRTFAAFVGESDVCVMHSVVDILGLNGISRPIFDNAAAAMAGMVHDAGSALGTLGEHCVGITMLGQTTPGVMRLREALVRAGHEPVIFHANGVGGPAMEHLCEEGALQGVVDYTLSELANSLLDGIHSTGPERLTVAGRLGLPQVVVPGCVDFFNQGPRYTVPERYRDRKSYFHNPVATLVRLTRDEGAELGGIVAARLNGSVGPVCVVAPTRGFS
ncbi:MAG TPA: Tm-1-like ATP-binding domain-containing protein, partial [Solirubrobacter sp.]|nr:Tm-1-like ATP-binding domain-containing protein [Solirubrobacter sp.]